MLWVRFDPDLKADKNWDQAINRIANLTQKWAIPEKSLSFIAWLRTLSQLLLNQVVPTLIQIPVEGMYSNGQAVCLLPTSSEAQLCHQYDINLKIRLADGEIVKPTRYSFLPFKFEGRILL